MPRWTIADIPPQTGRTAIVTGGNSGIGIEIARGLARAGASVVIATRSAERGLAAVAGIRAGQPGADVAFEALDLASLASIRTFAARMAGRRIDLLVNNAGVMEGLVRKETADGFERQFGVNYLGPFALTALLWPGLVAARGRVVNVTSTSHFFGRIDFDDPNQTKSYRAFRGYAQSKLAMVLFSLELARRAAAADSPVAAVVVHPGLAKTKLYDRGDARGTVEHTVRSRLARRMIQLTGRSAEAGAGTVLYAATAPGTANGGFYSPRGVLEGWGQPTSARHTGRTDDAAAAARLWALSEELTRVRFEVR